ncbi:carbohydrate kinase family protein [Tropicimonas sp.]|uniref:carbohydrate kinase family protein n=1 Tax=Tropicimonas sp. TaxID=2067044 RepID=UPI003A865C1C
MQDGRSGFITGGTWCVDYNMTVARWPDEESSTRILSVDAKGGGSGCNFAVDMRRLDPGTPVATIALCGDDADGHLLTGIAREHGIDASRFTVDPALATHRTMAFTSLENGKRTHLFEADASDSLSPDHFDFSGCTAWLLHLGIPGTHALLDAPWKGDPNGWVNVLRKARAAGLKTNLEVMSIPRDDLRRIILPCLPYLDFLVVNDYEIGALADVRTIDGGETSVSRVVEAAHEVLRRGSMETVVSHFPAGAVAVLRDGTVHTHASVDFPAGKVAGTNGAGDAFAAGFFCAYQHRRPVRDCLQLAHASAAASLRSVDTYSALMPAADCLKLAKSHGWRDELGNGDAPPRRYGREGARG